MKLLDRGVGVVKFSKSGEIKRLTGYAVRDYVYSFVERASGVMGELNYVLGSRVIMYHPSLYEGVRDSANEKVYEMNIGVDRLFLNFLLNMVVCVLENFLFHFIIIVGGNVQYYTILSINVRVWIVTLRSNKIIGKNFSLIGLLLGVC